MVTYPTYISSYIFQYEHVLHIYTLRWIRYVIYHEIHIWEQLQASVEFSYIYQAIIINIKFTNTFFVLKNIIVYLNRVALCSIVAQYLHIVGSRQKRLALPHANRYFSFFYADILVFGQGELSFYFLPWHKTIFERWLYN